MRHFEATGQKHPLVVKLGTITANGADVYSYASDESDMVEDPDLVCPRCLLSQRRLKILKARFPVALLYRSILSWLTHDVFSKTQWPILPTGLRAPCSLHLTEEGISGRLRLDCVFLQAQHLAHWGINMMSMQKTEKTMAELQIDLNMSFEFDKITESGESLQPLSGPG